MRDGSAIDFVVGWLIGITIIMQFVQISNVELRASVKEQLEQAKS